MIPYADFEFAIRRWKARAAGLAEPEPESLPMTASGTVEVSPETDSAPPAFGGTLESDSGIVAARQGRTSSGSILVDESLLGGRGDG